MSMNTVLRKLAVVLEKRQDALFSYDVEKQKKYIESLGQPKDEIERSYFQYKCQMQFNGKMITFMLNIISLLLLLLYLVKYGRKRKINTLSQRELVFFRDGKPGNILPNSLKEKYQTIENNPMEGILLTKSDKRFIKKIIRRYPLSWQFVLKCMIKIGRYSYAIQEYSPKAITVCAEYSFTSSVLTAYCREKNIRHINVMHGEKLYYMRDSFFKFDECYVWDEYYAKLLTLLKADQSQFVVERPDSLMFDNSIPRTYMYDYTYYLGAESDEVLQRIAKSLKEICERGNKIAIRPHPRYSDIEIINNLFAYAVIEDTKNISIEYSLMRTKHAISLYSTVLNQALCNNIPVIIDDISNPRNYRKLSELGYVCLSKEHEVLSYVMEKL